MAAPLLAEDGAMVCLQNGLCEERVAKIVGDDRVIGGVVAWGATMPEPGLYERTAAGGFTLGRLDGRALGPSHDALVRALEAIGPVETTDNLRGKRWSKLAINCAISSLGTIGGDRLGALMPASLRPSSRARDHDRGRRRSRARRACASRRCPARIDLSWIALDEAERAAAGSPSLVAKHGLLARRRLPLPSHEELDALGDRAWSHAGRRLPQRRGRRPRARARDPGARERARSRHRLVDRERQEASPASRS